MEKSAWFWLFVVLWVLLGGLRHKGAFTGYGWVDDILLLAIIIILGWAQFSGPLK